MKINRRVIVGDSNFQWDKTESEVSKGVKAGKNGTLVVFLLDASASMKRVESEAIEGYNSYVVKTKEDKTDKCRITTLKFDGSQVHTLYEGKPIEEVEELTVKDYQADGYSTNLLDAIAFTIEKTDRYLKQFKKKKRPSVMFIINTDGQENSSRHFSNEQVKSLVLGREKKGWVFSFVGADIDAFGESHKYGFAMTNTLYASKANLKGSYDALANMTSNMRGMTRMGASADAIKGKLVTEEDRKLAS